MTNASDNQLANLQSANMQIQDSQISLRELMHLIGSGGKTIAITTLCFVFAGILYSVVAPPSFKADGLVQVEENDKSGSMSSISDISSLLLGSPVETQAEIQILQSRMILNQVIDKMNLLIVVKPKRFPIVGGAFARYNKDRPTPVSPFLGLSSFAWGGEHVRIDTLEVPGSLLEEDFLLKVTADGYDLFDPDGVKIGSGKVGEELDAEVEGGKVKILVGVLGARPDTKFNLERRSRQEVLKGLTTNLNVLEQGKQSGVIGVEFAGGSAGFVAQIINNIENFYLAQNVERRSADAQQSLEFLEKQLPELKGRVDDAQAALNKYQVEHGSVDVTSETQLTLQQSVDLENQRLQLIQQRDLDIQRFTAKHPVVVALNQQIASVEAAQNQLHGQEQKLPKTQQQVFSLMRDLDVGSQLYTQLLNSIQELQVAKAGTIGNVRIIDYALEPNKPYWPKIPVILLLSVILGLIFGSLLVLLQRALLRGVDDPAEIELRLGLTIYATVPFVQEQRRVTRSMERAEPGTHILAAMDGSNPAIEAIRSLRTALHFALLESSNNVLMLTGPSPGLGKSFLSVNLGAVLALSGKRIVVIDGDLRRGQLHRYIGEKSVPGLADYVAGDVDRQALIRESGVPGLHVITHGTIPPNPAELLMHERCSALIESLSKEYDYVVIDAPPILAVTDAAILGRLCGSTLVVLKAAEHSMREIEETVRRLLNAGVKVRGVLLNQVGARAGSYGYGKYGYGYINYRYDTR